MVFLAVFEADLAQIMPNNQSADEKEDHHIIPHNRNSTKYITLATVI